jgi:hypothetical protein
MPAVVKAAGSQRTTGTPRPRTFDTSRQVSWLAGHCLRPAFPDSRPVALHDVGSPLTVEGGSAGIVPITRSARTGFPLSSGASNSPENLDIHHYGRPPTSRQAKYKDIFISLYWSRAAKLWRQSARDAWWEPVRASQFICDRTGFGANANDSSRPMLRNGNVDYVLGVAQLP